MRKLVWWMALLGLVVAGRRLDASVALDVREDGSGTYTIEAGLDDELRELLGQFGISAEDLVQTLQSGLPEGSSATGEPSLSILPRMGPPSRSHQLSRRAMCRARNLEALAMARTRPSKVFSR